MEPTYSAFDREAWPQLATENTAISPPSKRPKLSQGEPAPTMPGFHPHISHNGVEGLHDSMLTKAQVDYWRWKYEEVSQYVAVSMPPGLLSSIATTPGKSCALSHGTRGPQQGNHEDLELAYEINIEMGLIPRTKSRERGVARGPQCDHGTDSLESTRSSLAGEECGVTWRDTLLRSPSTSAAGSDLGENDLDGVLQNVQDLGMSLQRQAREQLDLIQMPPPR